MSLIFGIDSSEVEASVCVLRDGQVLFEKELSAGLTLSETLLPLVQEAFSGAGIASADVSAYAISAGPGSFTGLRIGLSLVKGLAFPFGTPVAAVSTLQGVALSLPPVEGSLVVTLNARRGEVYWAVFEGGEDHTRLEPDTAGPAQTLGDVIVKYPEPIIFVGSGAEMCYTLYKERYAIAYPPPRRPTAYGAALAGRAMEGQGLWAPAGQARPSYLRLSQAERERKKRLENDNLT